MIAIRSLFAAIMAIMIAGSVAQSSSSSSSSSSSTGSLSSSSAPAGNDSSSSSVWVLSSSSSTGADGPSYLPYGTYQVIYQVELPSTVVSQALKNALAEDFASTIVNNTVFNSTSRDSLLEYIRLDVTVPAEGEFTTLAAVNATTNAWILGNITNLLPGVNTQDLASAFAVAAASGTVQTQAASVYNVVFYPQQVEVVMAPYESSTGGDGGNGASSAASASLLIGSMIAALALAL